MPQAWRRRDCLFWSISPLRKQMWPAKTYHRMDCQIWPISGWCQSRHSSWRHLLQLQHWNLHHSPCRSLPLLCRFSLQTGRGLRFHHHQKWKLLWCIWHKDFQEQWLVEPQFVCDQQVCKGGHLEGEYGVNRRKGLYRGDRLDVFQILLLLHKSKLNPVCQSKLSSIHQPKINCTHQPKLNCIYQLKLKHTWPN